MIWVAALLFGLALAFLAYSYMKWKAGRDTRREHRIPEGEITYTDLDRPGRPLFSQRLRLAGKPDYIVKTGGGMVPVELKSTEAKSPYRNHILQLASYCLLVEDTLNARVPYGSIVYSNREFKVPFDGGLRKEVLAIMEEMRERMKDGKVDRGHDSRGRCSGCSFNSVCSLRIS